MILFVVAAVTFSDCKQVLIGTSAVEVKTKRNGESHKTDGHGRYFFKKSIESRYECPPLVTVGTKTFRVRQMDSPKYKDSSGVIVPGFSTLNIRLDGTAARTVPVWTETAEFSCCTAKSAEEHVSKRKEEGAHEWCQTVTIGSHWNSRDGGERLTIGPDGWVSGRNVPVPDPKMVCPKEVNRGNWLKDHAKVNANGHANSRDVFETRMVNGAVQVRAPLKSNGNRGHWAVHLAFECCRPIDWGTCQTVIIGNSAKAKPTNPDKWGRSFNSKTHMVQNIYKCPAAVQMGDQTFAVRQTPQPGQVASPVTIRMQKINADGNEEQFTETPAWTEKLWFECCLPIIEPCQQVVIGSHWNSHNGHSITFDDEGWVTSMAVPVRDGLVCPANVNKTNWVLDHAKVNFAAHANSNKNFKTRMQDGAVQVQSPSFTMNNGKKEWSHWATHLAFDCCPTALAQGPIPFDLAAGGSITGDQLVMAEGEKVWHDREDVWSAVPSFLINTDFIQQAHKNVAKGTVLTVTPSRDATLYVAVEASHPGENRHGGYLVSLPQAGFTIVPDVRLEWKKGHGFQESKVIRPMVIFHKQISTSILLPATTTTETVATIFLAEALTLPAKCVKSSSPWDCKTWNCEEWCTCWSEDHESIYRSASCDDDGEACLCDGSASEW